MITINTIIILLTIIKNILINFTTLLFCIIYLNFILINYISKRQTDDVVSKINEQQHTCTYAFTYAFTYVCTYAYTHAHIAYRTRPHTYSHTYTHTHTPIHTHPPTHPHPHVHTYAYTHTPTNTHAHCSHLIQSQHDRRHIAEYSGAHQGCESSASYVVYQSRISYIYIYIRYYIYL